MNAIFALVILLGATGKGNIIYIIRLFHIGFIK